MDFEDSTPRKYVELTDTQLWLESIRGSSKALGKLYARHAGLVYGIAFNILKNAEEAEDLTHDIFFHLVKGATYDPARGSLRTYVAMLTRSRAIDQARSRQAMQRSIQRLQRSHASNMSSPPLADVTQQEQQQHVQAALSQLSDSQRQVLQLAYYEGLTQAKIAEKLATPLGTVKTRARRGLLKLQQILKSQLD
ncbi:sigma-70 family RNA polymerase sigma factor [Leptolyngbya cf. ectocarpi LEGE 11479]|uniref:Sigma-70 family RNA polymerase sigma factor n=1 Tax=Leptolyngbya cf. ectocarpi LEGE 11479 TaxID=1828722 RepID=A0A928X358_LEPEC|nr:sigma-70 family RNA polymerase sigma factor [Leptolyngbya ectocarpi]MBE9066496.1 sigma-70 family RNA polymerase sigma factor [Leptolyngbya cf. ectocarpi LEGE 11479]